MDPLPCVLAVDDEERGVELVRRTLRRIARVEIAGSGAQALAQLEARSFDLVISDQRMPAMSGVELLARVAARSPETGRILLTGYADMDATVQAINEARVHAYLNKPCPPDQLRLTVSAVLERAAEQREAARLRSARTRWQLHAGRVGDCIGSLDEAIGQAVQAAAAPGVEAPLSRAADELEKLAALWRDLQGDVAEPADPADPTG